jgi:hypothetical protein
MSSCRFCGAPVDYVAAQSAADLQDEINRACSDGNYLFIVARAMIVMYLISWIPVIGGVGGWGFLALLVAVPVMAIRWWVKYRKIQTVDPDYRTAKRRTIISIAIWGGMVIVWLIGAILYTPLFSEL